MHSKPTVPSPRSLLQPIGLVQTTNKIRMGGILKTRRLYAVNCISQGTMQKSILDVELMNRPAPRESQREHCVNSGWLHHRTESLREIHTRPLGKTTKNLVHHIPFERPVRPELVLEDPLPGDNVGPSRTRHKILGVIL